MFETKPKPLPNIKLPLTSEEKQKLRQKKLRIRDLATCSVAQIELFLEIPTERARMLAGLAEFQTIPSVGIKFAEDLIFLGYYSIASLKGQEGYTLVEEYERQKGYWTDSCVEDQFRLITYVANTGDRSRQWFDFTEERKAYRAKFGYPADRPTTAWWSLREKG